MRTTLDLPELLINRAMQLINTKSKTGTIKLALEELIRKLEIAELKSFKGAVDLDLNMDSIRKRS